jgi:hypothetical protein
MLPSAVPTPTPPGYQPAASGAARQKGHIRKFGAQELGPAALLDFVGFLDSLYRERVVQH